MGIPKRVPLIVGHHHIHVGSWSPTDGPGWVELDIPASDCKPAAPDATYIAEVSFLSPGDKGKKMSAKKWLDLARVSALFLSFSRVVKMEGCTYTVTFIAVMCLGILCLPRLPGESRFSSRRRRPTAGVWNSQI